MSGPLHTRLDLPSAPSATRAARLHAEDVLRAWRVPSGAMGDALVIVDELVTNAVRHADPQPPGGQEPFAGPEGGVRGCALNLQLVPGNLLIVVHDHDRRPPVLHKPSDDAESGRGLLLVAGLSADWGYAFPSRAPGKFVWARVPTTTTEDPRTTGYVPALLPVCGRQHRLPDELAPAAAAFAPPGARGPEHVERELRCVLQAHTGGPHDALAMDLPGPDTGAVWATWEGTGPLRLAVRPDCPAVSTRDPYDACVAYADHPGAHTHDVADPWRLSLPLSPVQGT